MSAVGIGADPSGTIWVLVLLVGVVVGSHTMGVVGAKGGNLCIGSLE